jgi:hypothetical protein
MLMIQEKLFAVITLSLQLEYLNSASLYCLSLYMCLLYTERATVYYLEYSAVLH